MTNFVLTEEEAIVFAQQQFAPDLVKLSSINFNWGPPIGGRFDTDEMVIRVKVATKLSGTLFLQGKNIHEEWALNIELMKTGTFKEKNSNNEFALYSLRLSEQYDFPTEFVLRFDSSTGESYYDNNNGQNYVVTPYAGFGGNAMVGEEALFDLGRIKNYKAYFKSFD